MRILCMPTNTAGSENAKCLSNKPSSMGFPYNNMTISLVAQRAYGLVTIKKIKVPISTHGKWLAPAQWN